MRKLQILIVICLLLLFTKKAFALAQDEFDTSYQISYTVLENTNVRVEQNINLTNKIANIYASQYQVTLGTTRVYDVWARDSSGVLTPTIEKTENSTTIKVKFNQKVVGKGNTLNFTLGYISQDYAFKSGRILEIGIPKISETYELQDYNVDLIIPLQFEQPAFILPKPTKVTQTKNNNIFSFNKKSIEGQSITAAFGNYQLFNFILNYHLINKNPTKVYYQIALPPDTPFQQIYYQSIIPKPEQVETDIDGNWLAKYSINPLDRLDIIASGSAETYIKPFNKDIKVVGGLKSYLSSQTYWELDNPKIQKLAQQYSNPKAIYDYVADNLIYDYARVDINPQRLGAAAVLNNQASAVCMEFTDLFIAIARAAGIPAREVNGYAYTNNPKLRPLSLQQDVLHSWPQYYNSDKKLWIDIDPTWANTTGGIDFFNKLDLNHITFVIHGQDSKYPLAAGSYKDEVNQTKDVVIDFGADIEPKIDYNLDIALPQKAYAGTNIKGKLTINNIGNKALYNQILTVKSYDFGVENKFNLNVLPPYGYYEKEINLPKTNILLNKVVEVNINFMDKNYYHPIEIKSFFPAKIANILHQVAIFLEKFLNKIVNLKTVFK